VRRRERERGPRSARRGESVAIAAVVPRDSEGGGGENRGPRPGDFLRKGGGKKGGGIATVFAD